MGVDLLAWGGARPLHPATATLRPGRNRSMIVERIPRLRQIAADVWKVLSVLFLWDVAVTAFYFMMPFKAPALPLTLFGTVLALFLGFKGNSAYQRWWEGRILWGAMVNASRSLARASVAFLGADVEETRRMLTAGNSC